MHQTTIDAPRLAEALYTPQHVANFFLDRADREGRRIDPMKLQKLVYIGYGWMLALTGRRLFGEAIEAWEHGPVVPSLYHEFKRFKSRGIDSRSETLDLDTWDTLIPDIDPGDADALNVLSRVWGVYKRFSGWDLREKTHEAGTPWSETYSEFERDRPIPDDLISKHFKDRIRLYLNAAA